MYVQNWRYNWTEATKEILLLKWMAYLSEEKGIYAELKEYLTIFKVKIWALIVEKIV